MDVFQKHFSQDLTEPVVVRHCGGVMFTGDALSDTVSVEVFNDGQPATLGGTVVCKCIRADGGTVAFAGTLSGNTVSATLPAAAFAVTGPLAVVLQVVDGGTKMSVLKAVYTVDAGETGTAIDPGTVIQDVSDLIAAIEAAIGSIPPEYSALLASIAPTFSASTAYPAGAYVWYDGTLYRFATNHTAGTWTGTDVTAAVVSYEVDGLKSAFIKDTEQITGNTPYIFTHGYYRVYNDLTVVDITAPERSNTTSQTMATTLIAVQPGEKYTIRAYGAGTTAASYGYLDENCRGIYRSTAGILYDTTITVPDSVIINEDEYVPAWLIVNNNLTNNESNYYAYKGDSVATRLAAKQDALTFDSTPTSDSLNPVTSGGIYADLLSNVLRLDRTATSIPSNSDLNNYTTAGNYYVLNNATAQTIEHMPIAVPGKLIVFYTTSSANFYQVYVGSGTVAIYYRRTTGTWRHVQPILKATGDTTDISATIVTVLESGVCQLDPGDYYVSGIEMPDDSMLIGAGPKTRIILLDSVTTGAAIKMGSRCVVKNLSVVGADSDLTFDTSGSIESIHIGTRHGILWLGDGEYGSRVFGTISDCYIHGFSGGGITCENTGYSHAGGLNAENCQIYNCGAGINVSYWSEFSRFTNINANECYYGCINNGGNNVFVNCGFTANEVGFYTNGDTDKCVLYNGAAATVRNGGHGSLIGCVINHSGLGENTNHGYAIYYKTIDSGFIFDGLQIFYGKIYFRGGGFVNVSNTNFGNTVEIIIYTSSIMYLFSMCRFRSESPKFYVYSTSDGSPMTDYDEDGNIPKIKLINCYIGAAGTLASLAAVAGDYNA